MSPGEAADSERQICWHDVYPYTLSILEGVAFEWDARKNEANRRKHGIDFRDAARIFGGPIIEGPDEREDEEVRMIAFGELGPPGHRGSVHVARREAPDHQRKKGDQQ